MNITKEDKSIINDACKNVLVKDGVAWIKSSTGLHDIPMGSFPGAEVCEMVGLYMLTLLRGIQIEAILYRDNGALISYKGGRSNQIDLIKIKELFMKENLNIVISANLHDVTLDLTSGELRPFNKT